MTLHDAINARYAAQAAQAKQDARRARVELAVHQAAAQFGADPKALLASPGFVESLTDVDPSDVVTIGERIRDAVEADTGVRPPAPAAPPAPGAPVPASTLGPASLLAGVESAMRQQPGVLWPTVNEGGLSWAPAGEAVAS